MCRISWIGKERKTGRRCKGSADGHWTETCKRQGIGETITMLTLVIGGSGSGKSVYAERLAASFPGKKVYLATMEPFDDECRARIRRHRDQRKTIGFETVECYTNLAGADIPAGACVLLEDLSNLLANEMFSPEGGGIGQARRGLAAVEAACGHLIVVTNEVFSGGDRYEGETVQFMKNLAVLNRELAARAQSAVEVVSTIPVELKKEYFTAPDGAEKKAADRGLCPEKDEAAADRGLCPEKEEAAAAADSSFKKKEAEEPASGRERKQMIFVTGPAFSGKQEYIQRALGLDDKAFAECAVRDVQDLALSKDPDELADRLAEKRIVIATEIGGGIVPADPEEREKREAAGRLACRLAERADTVIRVCCGLPQVLKGNLQKKQKNMK